MHVKEALYEQIMLTLLYNVWCGRCCVKELSPHTKNLREQTTARNVKRVPEAL